jgi:hypothetical protein
VLRGSWKRARTSSARGVRGSVLGCQHAAAGLLETVRHYPKLLGGEDVDEQFADQGDVSGRGPFQQGQSSFIRPTTTKPTASRAWTAHNSTFMGEPRYPPCLACTAARISPTKRAHWPRERQLKGSGAFSVVTVGRMVGHGALCQGDAGAMLINF